jgi:hypothetical protein
MVAQIPPVSTSQNSAQAQLAADAVTARMSRQNADSAGAIRELAIDQTYAAKPIPVSATGSGGYSLTPAELQQQYEQCTALLRKFRTAYFYPAQTISNTSPPAADTAGSVAQANAVAALGVRASEKINSHINFLTDWLAKLEAAKERYLEQEHLTEAQWRDISSGGPHR